MIGKKVNSEEAKYIIETKKNSKNIYSKIAPPNTFKMRTSNQVSKKPKIFQRYEKTPQSNQISNPYINYNSNFAKRSSFISNNTAFISNVDSNIKLSQNINSSFREKIKIIKGNLFNNQNNIISPKKLIMGKMKVNSNNNKTDNNKIKMPVQIFVKNKSVYIKKDRNNILKSFKENTTNYEEKKKKILKNNELKKEIKNEINYNNINNDFIKEKYDDLLEKTRNLLLNYQKIVEYYQEREKNNLG